MTVASQGETLLLTLFSFFGESGATVFDWTHLSGRFRDLEFSFSNCLLNSQPLVLKGDEDMHCSFFELALCL